MSQNQLGQQASYSRDLQHVQQRNCIIIPESYHVADERVILFSHCEINFAGVWNVEVRPAISTDPNPSNPNRIPNCKLSLLEMAANNITHSSATLPVACCLSDSISLIVQKHPPSCSLWKRKTSRPRFGSRRGSLVTFVLLLQYCTLNN